jgi:hypothetical protein
MASTSSSHPGGRPPARVITRNFTELNKVDNKSRRKSFQCNYCGDDSSLKGHQLQHHDHVLLLHLINHKECPNASSEVHETARLELMQKGVGTQVTVPLFRDNVTSTSVDESQSALTALMAVASTAVKKWKIHSGNLESYVDRARMKEQIQTANVKLFW